MRCRLFQRDHQISSFIEVYAYDHHLLGLYYVVKFGDANVLGCNIVIWVAYELRDDIFAISCLQQNDNVTNQLASRHR